MQDIIKQLRVYGKVRLNEPMSKHTTFKIGGAVAAYVQIASVEDVPAAVRFLDGEGIAYRVVGGGSNMLWNDETFDGVVIEIVDDYIRVDGDTVVAHAGAQTVKVAQAAVKAGLAGFAWGVGVPGTIGGALRGNAGAMGYEMKDAVLKVQALIDGEVTELSNKECDFRYRHSRFKDEGGIVLKVWLTLSAGDAQAEMRKALEALKYRNETQPKGYASTGCIFKNMDCAPGSKNEVLLTNHFDPQDEKVKRFKEIRKISAGWLVEQAGMKGKQVGDAQVSAVHGNFIVSLGNARAADVKTLIEQIKQEVYTRFGFELEEEIFINS